MHIYQLDTAQALSGPVHLPLVPGFGQMLPAGFVQLEQALPNPKHGFAWAMGESGPVQLEDLRGAAYITETGATTLFDKLGPLPADLTKQLKPSAAHHWDGEGWVINPAYVYEIKGTEINRACEAAITSGFQSSALGDPHQYSSQLDDQLNLTGAILRGLDMPYACRDEQGVKAFRLHTAAQLRQVGDDFTLYKLQLLQHANELKQQLDLALAAGDAEAMELITWEAPQP